MHKVVVSGTYHRDAEGLARIFRELEATHCRILSPLSIDFFDEHSAVVRTAAELGFSPDELEKFHLRAIREADFIWFHCPDGYLGLSAAYELGFARALTKPAFCYQLPNDEMLRTQLSVVPSVFEALELLEIDN